MAKNLTKLAFSINTSSDLIRKVPQFDYNKYVYIRGTKEGYQAVASKFNTILMNQKPQIQTAGVQMVERYFNRLRQSIVDKNQVNIQSIAHLFTNDWQMDWGEAWVEGLNNFMKEAMASVNMAQEPISTTIDAVNKAVSAGVGANVAQQNQSIDNISTAITNLLNFYNALPGGIQQSLIGVLNPSQLPSGATISYKNLGKALNAMANYITQIQNLMKQASGKDRDTILTDVRRSLVTNLGTSGEWLLTYILSIGTPVINKAIADTAAKANANVKITGVEHLGTASPTQSSTTISSRSKPDEVITYSFTYGNKSLDWQIGISQKETGNIFYDASSGQWKLKEERSASTIKIFDTIRFWQMAQQSFPSSIAIENAILNTTLWTTAASGGNKIIRQSMIAHLVDQFLAGSGTLLKGSQGAYDITDCIMINGVAVPIYKILLKLEQDFREKGESKNIAITYSGLTDQRKAWEGTYGVKNMTDALIRSRKVMDFMKSMQVIVNIKANLLVGLMNS